MNYYVTVIKKLHLGKNKMKAFRRHKFLDNMYIINLFIRSFKKGEFDKFLTD